MMYIDFPFHINSRGRTSLTDKESHIRDLIEQVLFTSPGERINRPDFGSGLMQLVFGPAGEEMATATQFLAQGALQQWLGELIEVEAVEVKADDSSLRVKIAFKIRRNQQHRVAEFRREIP